MLTIIRNHKISRWISGLILAGLLLFLPISIFRSIVQKPSVHKAKLVEMKSSNKKEGRISHPNKAKYFPEPTAKVNDIPISKNVSLRREQQSSPLTHWNVPNEKNVYLLARVIHAEARGEPFEGQVAVGAVLLNRLRTKGFPKTISGIIFKRGEFCTVRDGQIWMTPNYQAIRAARLAVSGWDPTGGAVYFYNPRKTTSRWIWSRLVIQKIGNHFFAV